MAADPAVYLENYKGMVDAYRKVRKIEERYGNKELKNAADDLEEITSSEPSQSVYLFIRSAKKSLEEAEESVSGEDARELSSVFRLLEEEIDAHPAMTAQRHYSSRRDGENF